MNEFWRRIDDLAVWRQAEKRAPHKPLLLLFALGRAQRGLFDPVPFLEVEEGLKDALAMTLNNRKTQVSYPFWNLQSDGLWVVEGAGGARLRGGNKEPVLAELRRPMVTGQFAPDVTAWLRAHPEDIVAAARKLLDAHFPATLHEDLCQLFELDLNWTEKSLPTRSRRRRDPAFRSEVLRAYEFRCAVCGFDGRMDQLAVGIEAAHVQWHQAMGPDLVENGLALCSIHHKLFDLGVFSLAPDLRVVVSDLLMGGDETAYWMVRHHGQPLLGPRPDKPKLAEKHRIWHWTAVFRTPARSSVKRSAPYVLSRQGTNPLDDA